MLELAKTPIASFDLRLAIILSDPNCATATFDGSEVFKFVLGAFDAMPYPTRETSPEHKHRS